MLPWLALWLACAPAPTLISPDRLAHVGAVSTVDATTVSSGDSAVGDAARPNVLVVLFDDVGADQLEVFGGGDQAVATPALAGLAARGVTYPFAYAYPTCSPARAALVTGVHGHRNGVTRALRTADLEPLSEDVSTYAEVIDDQGAEVATAWVGKWHLTPPGNRYRDHPNERGFDHFAGTLGSLYAKFHSQRRNMNHYRFEKIVDGVYVQVDEVWSTTDVVDDALAAIHQLPQPWFMVVATQAAHDPYSEPPPGLIDEPLEGTGDAAVYRRMIQGADAEIGRLLDEVDLDRTVVVYLGDNGVPSDVTGPVVSPDQAKGTLAEGGVRVGMIAAGPGVPEGVVSEQLVSIVDIVPTAAELQGVSLVAVQPDGVSLAGSWDAGDLVTPLHTVVRTLATGDERTSQMVRGPDFKLVATELAGVHSEELYDLRHGATRDGDDLLLGDLSPDAEQALEALRGELLPL